jgi:hypothetical protein
MESYLLLQNITKINNSDRPSTVQKQKATDNKNFITVRLLGAAMTH